MVSPDFTQDVFPVQGTIYFRDQEFSKTLTVYSLVDEVSAAHVDPRLLIVVVGSHNYALFCWFVFCGAVGQTLYIPCKHSKFTAHSFFS